MRDDEILNTQTPFGIFPKRLVGLLFAQKALFIEIQDISLLVYVVIARRKSLNHISVNIQQYAVVFAHSYLLCSNTDRSIPAASFATGRKRPKSLCDA